MIKLLLAFAAFAALALFLLSRGGDIDMGGEKHGVDVRQGAATAVAAATSQRTPAALA